MVTGTVRRTGGKRLSAAVTKQRARRIRLVLSDVDGVLTDAGVYYSARGEELYRFSRRDGMAVDILRTAGIESGILTSEPTEIIRRRSEKLRLPFVFLDIRDKLAYLPSVLSQSGVRREELAYIGDDINDLALIQEIGRWGLTASPADAVPAILRAVHYRCAARGGQGAFREFAEWILSLRA